jgi:hypothetical protein
MAKDKSMCLIATETAILYLRKRFTINESENPKLI